MIGVYSVINNITGFIFISRLRFGLPRLLWVTLWCTYTGALIPCMLLESRQDISVSSYTETLRCTMLITLLPCMLPLCSGDISVCIHTEGRLDT